MNNNTDIQGSASISRNARVGGSARVNGDVSVGHNLRVEGWLDAPNTKGALKGLYKSEEALNGAYPRPGVGWYALVGDALPAAVWRAERGEDGKVTWVDTGERGGNPDAHMASLEEDMAYVRDKTAELEEAQTRTDERLDGIEAREKQTAERLTGLEGALERETAEREAATAAEKAEREAGDAAILGSVDIGDLDNVTAAEALLSVMGGGAHRYDVRDGGKIVGTLEVMGDEMGHVYTQVLTTHREIEDGQLTASHRDDKVCTYYRSYGLPGGGMSEGEWSRWKKISGGGSGDMAIEVDQQTGDVNLIIGEDGDCPIEEAYINERGEIVMELRL